MTLITWILVRGIRESAGFNSAMVVLKLVIIVFFIAVGAFYVKPANWTPFAPNGLAGISSAAAIIFFAYIGFDAVSTAAEETRNPQRDMPIGIIASLDRLHGHLHRGGAGAHRHGQVEPAQRHGRPARHGIFRAAA